jgi:hypothetical protein
MCWHPYKTYTYSVWAEGTLEKVTTGNDVWAVLTLAVFLHVVTGVLASVKCYITKNFRILSSCHCNVSAEIPCSTLKL